MIASSPVGGASRRREATAVGVYVAALAAGAIAVTIVTTAAAQTFGVSRWIAGAAAVSGVLVAVHGAVPLPQSSWRVPQQWGEHGRIAYAFAFGFALGTGVLTALSSVGFYVVLAWSLSMTSWAPAIAVFGAFAVGRAVPLFGALSRGGRGADPVALLGSMGSMASLLAPLELALIGLVAGVVLV